MATQPFTVVVGAAAYGAYLAAVLYRSRPTHSGTTAWMPVVSWSASTYRTWGWVIKLADHQVRRRPVLHGLTSECHIAA
jgi:hypothetical protein